MAHRRSAGPWAEQGFHQVHVPVHDRYVQGRLTWTRERSVKSLFPALLETHPPWLPGEIPDILAWISSLDSAE